ncbi:putative multidrug export ATP-binding/permease protein [Oxobacter pfennigii]|uniref:Putative multidrug export ATP-binding/permease protein n=1 Tax=Oxobacter pfennigii TaxID=36849 RepID=A0A0N8NSX5_9CLOT|nr:ABC transporter ATP-binding protein [Oxobacter pfennigii]KPU43248.1 putative multidrug export ATP-binding/permease protein [Oxobacter pfennigii]
MVKKKSGRQSEKVKMSYLFELAGSKKRILYTAILFSILSGLSTFVPYVMVFRTVLFLFKDNGSMDAVMQYGLIAAVFILLRFIFQAISAGMTHIGAYNVLYQVRKKVCNHIGEVNLGFFTDNSTGEIKKVLMEDVERLEKFLAHQIPDITVAIVVPLAVLIYLLTVNIPMALILLLPIVVTLFLQYLMIVITKPLMANFPGVLGRLNSAILQFVNGMPVMKAYNLTANSYRDYSETGREYNDLWVKVAKIAAPLSAVCKVLIESGIFFTVPLGGWLYLSGKLELGAYIFFIIMSIVFLAAYNNLMNFAQIFSQISSGLERIKAVMDTPEMLSGADEISEPAEEHTVAFSHVTFAYQKREVLCDVCLTLSKGSLTAFVGPSGAGKSTAAQLIPRFWDVTKGSIRIDGKDIRELQTENLMELVSFVFQEAFMLDDTVYQNIAIGKPNCTRQEVEAAAKAAQIHDFILTLSKSYDTQIGTAGIKMSGGEKQRICIARAILKNSPIIIFDEATSFTDIENEHKIQMALGNLLKNKTIIMIAHRLHTIVNADQICVFDNGQVKEAGTHPQLLEKAGLYADMWHVYTEQGKEVFAK